MAEFGVLNALQTTLNVLQFLDHLHEGGGLLLNTLHLCGVLLAHVIAVHFGIRPALLPHPEQRQNENSAEGGRGSLTELANEVLQHGFVGVSGAHWCVILFI